MTILGQIYRSARKILTRNRLQVSTTTGFFRNDTQMETIIRLVPQPRTVYVFGCSEGCEAYSLAIHFRMKNVTPVPQIHGWDINEPCIQKARRAVYERSQMDYYGTGENLDRTKSQYFDIVGPDTFKVQDEIVKSCQFDVGSVLDETFMSSLPPADLVLCQNVLIHLNAEQNRTAVHLLKKLVAKGGLLAIGGMKPELRSAITSEEQLKPVTDDCREIHDGWRDLRGWWEDTKPWKRDYFALERFQETPDWPFRYSSLFRTEG